MPFALLITNPVEVLADYVPGPVATFLSWFVDPMKLIEGGVAEQVKATLAESGVDVTYRFGNIKLPMPGHSAQTWDDDRERLVPYAGSAAGRAIIFDVVDASDALVRQVKAQRAAQLLRTALDQVIPDDRGLEALLDRVLVKKMAPVLAEYGLSPILITETSL